MRYIKTIVLATAAVLVAGVLAQPARAEVSFELAYSNLSDHGSWLVSAQYGHVWQPRDYNRDWNPYYDGHWVYTDMGWAWVSDYQWGAIPYHYGTWVMDPRVGWVWIPGRTWAPSWVVFRTGGDYIGWAPVPPGYSVGMSIDFGGSMSFVFVSSRDFLAPRLRTSIIPTSRTSVFINNTTVVNNIVIQNNVVINRGPDLKVVEKATGRSIRPERIESVARVAPFEKVSRAQLAVEPERAKHGLRAAEPIPASQPLPAADKRGGRERNAPPAEASGSKDARSAPSTPRKDKASAPQTTDERAPAETQKARDAQAPPKPEAKAQAKPEAKAQAKPEAKAQAKPEAKAQAKPEAKAQAKPDAKAQAKPDAKAQAKPEAKPDAKANADAKAKAKAKKVEPDKKKQTSDDSGGTKDKDGAPR